MARFLSHSGSLEVDWALLEVGLAGSVPGAWLGARHSGSASERTLRIAFAVTLASVACVFAIEAAV